MTSLNLTMEAVIETARRIVSEGALSHAKYKLGVGETWAAELDGLFVVVDSLAYEVRLSRVRDVSVTGLEGRKFSMEMPSTWRVLDGAEAKDIRARLILRHDECGTFNYPGVLNLLRADLIVAQEVA